MNINHRLIIVSIHATPGPPEQWEQLADPSELVEIWAMDCWVMNLDREVFGNMLMMEPHSNQWHLLPADQSDCFLGAGSLSDGSYLQRGKEVQTAPAFAFLERAFQEFGCTALQRIVDRIEGSGGRGYIGDAIRRVPPDWWSAAGVDPEHLEQCLRDRAKRIRTIVRVQHWEGVANATKGGYRLNL